jgi:hypothetical protein
MVRDRVTTERTTTQTDTTTDTTTGAGTAAIVAGAIGAMALGFFVTLNEMSPAIKKALTFNNAVGPLSGKTTLAVIVWLLAWGVLHTAWRNRDVELGKYRMLITAMLVVGLFGTFPPFYYFIASLGGQ